MQTDIGTPQEWRELGFKCGVEVHHQVDTEKKLFCRCPAGQFTTDWHAEVLRHMRPTLSELGEYDGTALMEFKTKKEILYQLNKETVCTYEMDDNPPFPIDTEAVDKALTIAMAFKCKIVGELHVIRKQYLDGSIPTGFQRTTIIGVDGELEMASGKIVRVIQVSLEEDSCREVSDEGHRIVFKADRLGMPLVEVVTDKQFETPQEAAEGVERIRRMLRATGFVRRGMGAGRQDVNVSIEGSPRVEIKGVPRIPKIPYLTANEARRYKALLDLRDEMQNRNFDAEAELYSLTLSQSQIDKLENKSLNGKMNTDDVVRVIRVRNAKGLIAWSLPQGRTFADELEGRVRVIACIDQRPILLHTDGSSGSVSETDSKFLRGIAHCDAEDVAIAVKGPDVDTITAALEIRLRLLDAIVGVPCETRQHLPDHYTNFERILPGADRMYPDTDSPPYEIINERVEERRKFVPEAPWKREARYAELGVPEDISEKLSISKFAILFDDSVNDGSISAMRAGEALIRMTTALRREGLFNDSLSLEQWKELLTAVGSGAIKREVLLDAISTWDADNSLDLSDIIKTKNWTPAIPSEIDAVINEAIECAKAEVAIDSTKQLRVAMGIARHALEGRVVGSELHERLEGLLHS